MPRLTKAAVTRTLFLLAFILLIATPAQTANNLPPPAPPKPAQSIPELQQRLEKILADTHTPGVSVAIVHRDGPEWIGGVGKANVAANAPVTDTTLFRIGSTSKAFASLSILKLQSEGKLSLLDPVHKLVPEIWFENRWEATDPVLLVDLLEHTTGWDDMHLPEYAKNADGWTLRQGLDYYHHSRYSRWPPGTRMAYCNSGPAVAAFIVEKISGQRFEDYVTQNFFLPIGMTTATYFEQPSPQLTTLYHGDGKTPYPYWNILLRPAGAINASARDLAAYVRFYLNRGSVGGKQVVPASFIDRMETPTRAWAAQQRLKAGYGLSNYTSIHDGFVYHGHNGGVDGGLTEMAYLPDYGVGYFYSINAGNGLAFEKMGEAIRGYVTRGLAPPPVPAAAPLPADAQVYAGWYESDSPRNQFAYFIERLILHHVRFDRGHLRNTTLLSFVDDTFIPVSGEQFRYVPLAGRPEPIATVALLAPRPEGRFIQMTETWKQIPSWLAWVQILLIVWFGLALMAIFLYAPFWVLGGLAKRLRRPAERAIRLWPLIAAVSLLTMFVTFTFAARDAIARLGNFTGWSAAVFATTLLFGIAAAASLISLLLARRSQIRRYVYWGSVAVIIPLVIVAAYLAYWGVIGIRLWA